MIIDKQLLKSTAKFRKQIRQFFSDNNFIEVETPILTPIPGMEPHLTPFETALHTNKTVPMYLNTSPELQMKKLLGTGLKKIYNITKVFRDGEIGGDTHNPEFTMIEWYRQNASYLDLMTDCENLITALTDKTHLIYQRQKVSLKTPWERISCQELFLKYCKIDLLKNHTFKKFQKTANSLNFDTNGCQDWDDIFFKIFLNHIEPCLGKEKPTFVYDYPSTQAALAKKSDKEPFFAERFELYIAGIELANAFSELIDPNEQRQRLQEEQSHRKKLNKTVFAVDEEFLASLESIKAPCAGIALGLDRLFMLLLDLKSINDLLLFPTSKMLTNIHAYNNRHQERNSHNLQKQSLAGSIRPVREPR